MKKVVKERISDGERMAKLVQVGESIFSVQDLSTVWNIKNRDTLRMTLTRYEKKGLLYRIWRGLYSIVTLDKIDPKYLGVKILDTYAYVSAETVLYEAGLINQRPTYITYMSNKDKKFSLLGNNYWARKLPDELLYNSRGLSKKNKIIVADVARAKQDLKFFNPKKYYDANI